MSYYRTRQGTDTKPPKQVEPDSETVVTDYTQYPEVECEVEEAESTQPIISFNIPTLIRILEMIREDAITDEMLHFIVEKIVEVGSEGDTIDMADYEEIASVVPTRLMISQRRSRDGRRI